MSFRILVLGCLSLGAACSANAPDMREALLPDALTARSIVQGDIIGAAGADGGHKWLGLPYAAPPAGDLRWRAPRPPAKWDGVFEALKGDHACAQLTLSLDVGVEPGLMRGAEDCLYLNVWAPAFAKGEIPLAGDNRLPVMVFIHGGGNRWGFAGQYDAERLAVRHDLVIVTINYRLGPFGWFAHEALRKAAGDNPNDRTANFANLDMIAALEWVRDNISSFGGDSDRVTIFGQSAGGQNVASLLAIEKARGLFHGAIVQSGYFKSMSREHAEYGVPAAEGWPYAGARAAADKLINGADATSNNDIAAALRAASVEAVINASTDANGALESPFLIADGVVLTATSVEDALNAEQTHNAVPVITGANKDETKLFNIREPQLTRKLFGVFPQAKNPRLYDVVSEYQSAMWRVVAVDRQARRLTASRAAPVFAYRFDWDEEGRFLFSNFAHLIGAAHAMELPFLFNSFETFPVGGSRIFPKRREASRREISDAMMSYWAQFAYTGDPGRGRDGDLPVWSPWPAENDGERIMFFDTAAGGGIRLTAQAITAEGLYSRLERDARLRNLPEQCLALEGTIAWFPETTQAAASAFRAECETLH